MMDGFRTSITDIRSLIKTVTLFFNEIGTGLVTGWTGSTLNVAEYDFPAYILMLSRLVDTFFSRTSWTMLLYAENHSISVA